MITLNKTQYKLALIDTNILSEIVKNRFQEFQKILKWADSQKAIICFSLFSILEIRKVPIIYEKFLELFSVIPCIILKSHEQLLQAEVTVYPVFSNVDPVLVGFAGPLAKAKLKDVLDTAFNENQILLDEKKWNSGREEIVAGIKGLVSNFPPDNGKYTKQKIREFVQLAGFQQIAIRQNKFANSIVKSKNSVDIDAFPSIKMTSLVVFYKFYADSRQSLTSDAFDIIIFSLTPYVDVVISENHFVEIIKKIKSQDSFIDHVNAFNISYLRSL